MVELLTEKCQTDVYTGDVGYAEIVKSGPRQESPAGISLLLHENDPNTPSAWSHRPMPTDPRGQRVLGNQRVMIGGSCEYVRAFTLEVEAHGRSMDYDVERDDVRHVASTVAMRCTRALLAAGPKIGTGEYINDGMEKFIDGPYPGASWVDQEEGEALAVRKYVRFWYRTVISWSTDEW